MAYRPGAVRKVLIPKQRVLESTYDPIFLNCSYGFRSERSCHDAIKALHQYPVRHKVSTVIDIDLKSYFDTIDHLLEGMLQNKI